MGGVNTQVTHQPGVDPALLRALLTHHNRGDRQLNNQLTPEAGLEEVNISLFKAF
jgi:hypothetical protein